MKGVGEGLAVDKFRGLLMRASCLCVQGGLAKREA